MAYLDVAAARLAAELEPLGQLVHERALLLGEGRLEL